MKTKCKQVKVVWLLKNYQNAKNKTQISTKTNQKKILIIVYAINALDISVCFVEQLTTALVFWKFVNTYVRVQLNPNDLGEIIHAIH